MLDTSPQTNNLEKPLSQPSSADSSKEIGLVGELQTSPQTEGEGSPLSDFLELPSQSIQLCSSNTCSRGHSWIPSVMLVKCPGCQGPVLAVKMEQCPICNEPTSRFDLRADHITRQMGILPMCKGATSNGEIGIITLERRHSQETEERESN